LSNSTVDTVDRADDVSFVVYLSDDAGEPLELLDIYDNQESPFTQYVR